MTRLQQILVGAYRDLAHWRAQTPEPIQGDRRAVVWHNTQCQRATRGAVACDASKWLGRRLSAADSVSNSRVYRQMEERGLANRVALGIVGGAANKTSILALLPAGESEARRLIASLPEAAPATSPSPTSTASVGNSADVADNPEEN